MKRALSWILTAVGVILVSSCGSSAANPSETPIAPQYRELDRFQYEGYDIRVICRHNDMYILSDIYYGWGVQRIDNHEECK